MAESPAPRTANLPAIQLVQAAMAPTQLLLIIPFVRLGEWMLHVPLLHRLFTPLFERMAAQMRRPPID